MRKGNVVLGTVAGLVIGAIAGILFAPKKGSKTRKNIIHKGDDYLHKLKFEKAKKEARDAAKNLAENGKAKIKS